MSQYSLLPTPLAAAIYYLSDAGEEALANDLKSKWQKNQHIALNDQIARIIESLDYSNETLVAAQQELKHLAILTKGMTGSEFKRTDSRGHILVVSNHREIRQQIAKQLEINGHQVNIAKDRQSAEDALTRQYSELILIDLEIDQFEGLTLLDRLKSHSRRRNIPVLILSKTPNTTLAAKSIERGAYDFLSMPFSGSLFHARVNAALEESQQREIDLFNQRQSVRKHNLIHQLVGRYLNHAVVDKLLSAPGASDLGGELREVTLLMCDMRKFSTIADQLDPHQVVKLLNVYLGTMTEVVHQHGGIVNEFEGDSLLAIFNAPLPLHEHTVAALTCAVAMQNAIDDVNHQYIQMELPQISIGIGVVRGEVVVGNMGSERRMKFGVVGSPVNLSARLQAVAAGGEIVTLASQLSEGSGGAKILRTGSVLPKGFPKEVEVAVLVAPQKK